MRKILQSLALLVTSACTSPTTILKPTIEQRVQQEVRKMDDFVEWYVQSDYNKPKSQFASFALVNDEEMQEKFQVGRADAEYHYISDQIKLPITNNPEKKEDIEDQLTSVIIHEVVHSITDNMEKKGIIFWQDYKGPTNTQINEYMVKVTQREEFKSLKDKLNLKIKIIDLKEIIANNDLQYSLPLVESSHILKEFFNKLVKVKDDIHHLTESERKQLKLEYDELALSSNNALSLLNEYDIFLEKLNKQKKWDFKKATKNLSDFKIRFQEFDSLIKDTKIFDLVYDCHLDLIKTRKIFLDDANTKLKDAKNKKDKDRIKLRFQENFLTTYQKIYECIERDFDLSLSMLNLKSSSQLSESSYKFNFSKKMTQNILGDPHEVFARMVDSLYKLYLTSEPTDLNFKLKPQDLEFLSHFEYQGKQLFKKGIEKYHVALNMLEDGQDPKQVQTTLQQATDLEYEGKEFCWHDNNFTMQGTIPKEDY
jgi:hypothetical protein